MFLPKEVPIEIVLQYDVKKMPQVLAFFHSSKQQLFSNSFTIITRSQPQWAKEIFREHFNFQIQPTVRFDPWQAALHFNAQPSTGVNVVVGAAHFLFYLTAGVSPVVAEATIDFYTQPNNGAD